MNGHVFIEPVPGYLVSLGPVLEWCKLSLAAQNAEIERVEALAGVGKVQ